MTGLHVVWGFPHYAYVTQLCYCPDKSTIVFFLNMIHQVFIRHIHHTRLNRHKVKFANLYDMFKKEEREAVIMSRGCKLLHYCLKHEMWIEDGFDQTADNGHNEY